MTEEIFFQWLAEEDRRGRRFKKQKERLKEGSEGFLF